MVYLGLQREAHIVITLGQVEALLFGVGDDVGTSLASVCMLTGRELGMVLSHIRDTLWKKSLGSGRFLRDTMQCERSVYWGSSSPVEI